MASGVRTLSIAAALIAAGPAFAQEEVCSGGLNLAEFGAAMDMVDAAIAKPDVDDARYLLQQMHPKVPCLAVAAAPDAMTRYGALRATVAFFDQDESGVVQWGLMARYTAQDGDPFPGLPETHPLRDTLEFADEPPVSGPPGESLAPPKGGGVFLNGVLATQPLWRVEVPVLVQVFDKKERLVLSHWQDGAAFSDEILTSGTFPVDPPKWWLGPVIAPVEIEAPAIADAGEDKVKEKKTPSGDGPSVQRLAISGGVAVLSGTLYALAGASSGGLDKATTEDELRSSRSRTNLLVVGSSMAAAGAIGIGVTAFISNGPGVGLAVRF